MAKSTKHAPTKPARKRDPAKAPWNKPNPKPPGARARLSAAAKAQARARAEEAGRPYPNLIDNMWAARNVKS